MLVVRTFESSEAISANSRRALLPKAKWRTENIEPAKYQRAAEMLGPVPLDRRGSRNMEAAVDGRSSTWFTIPAMIGVESPTKACHNPRDCHADDQLGKTLRA